MVRCDIIYNLDRFCQASESVLHLLTFFLTCEFCVADEQFMKTSSPKGNDRSPESNVPRSNLISKTYKWAMETRSPKSNSSELLCLSWLPATLMMIRSKMNVPAWRQHFPISLGKFFRHSRAANSVVSGPIWWKFELVLDFMHVLITCKYKKDPIKNNREKVETSFFPL